MINSDTAKLLKIDFGKKLLTVVKTTRSDIDRSHIEGRHTFCLTSPTRNNVFIIGGGSSNGRSVSRHIITKDSWESIPELNIERFFASACTISGHIYVIGGREYAKYS
jgi:N-acetylneuraminic acid mutarotase